MYFGVFNENEVDLTSKFKNGNTLIFDICIKGKQFLLEILMNLVQNFDLVNDQGLTPLMIFI